MSPALDRSSVLALPRGRGRPTVDELVERAREAERPGHSTAWSRAPRSEEAVELVARLWTGSA